MINGKEYTYYQCTQKQRAMERDIRALKREINATEALGMDSTELRSKLRMKTVEYRKFSDSANLKPKNNRLRIQNSSVNIGKTNIYKKQNKLVRSQNRGIINNRSMANGMRKSPFIILEEEQIIRIKSYAKELGIPESVLSFNTGTQTGFVDGTKIIHVRGDILPDSNSTNNRDLLSEKAVLAHEYYGHLKHDLSTLRIGDWRNEFRASYTAAVNAPGLSDEERRMLMLDAYERAKEAGVPIKYNKKAREIIYGYSFE